MLNRTASLNDTANVELSGWEALLASMISSSLSDIYEEPPEITKNKITFGWLHENYYPKKAAIERNKKDAYYFFDSPKSLFNKYCNLDKEYLIKHYGRKYKSKETTDKR